MNRRALGVVLALLLAVLGLFVWREWTTLQRLTEGFTGNGFLVSQSGPFTFHYHDASFRDQVEPLAVEALKYDLEAFNLPAPSVTDQGISFYLCDSQKEYLSRSPYTRSWESASAEPAKRSIYLWKPPGGQNVLKNVLAHELSHLCYHQLLPSVPEDDDWLNEGLACYLGYGFAFEGTPASFAPWMGENLFQGLKDDHLPFKEFLAASPAAFGDDPARVELFYNQGFSLVFMLIHYFGEGNFLRFLTSYGQGRHLEPALAANYAKISSLQDLQGMWLLFMAS
jgi:hypothetical protein